jgi:hypothetical protein
LVALSNLHVWLGLKHSDDHGTAFDLRANVLKNGLTIARGETRNIRGLTHNATKATKVTVMFGTLRDNRFASGDVLSPKLMARVADRSRHRGAVGVRLYYDSVSRPARFGATLSASAAENTPPVAVAGDDQTVFVSDPVHLDGVGRVMSMAMS